MTNPYSGRPAVIQNSLPAAVNISASTNATPIVVSTSTAHRLRSGDYFVVEGADEPALNATPLMAGTVTTNTVVALLAPGSTNTVGTLAGGANGTLRATGFGTTMQILSDGDQPTASLWNVPYEALADRTAFLERLSYLGWEIAFVQWFTSGLLVGGGGPVNIAIGSGADIVGDTLPHGVFVQTLKVRVAPAVHAALPATMPVLTFYTFSLTGTIVSNPSQTDPSPNVGVYNVAHDITLTLAAPVFIDRTRFTYLINFSGEAGANAATLPIGPARVLLS